jgi:multiple sugar transport system substrate-binding protein
MKRPSAPFSLLAIALAIVCVGVPALAQTQPTTLRIFWWGSQTRHDRTLKVLDMYKAANPGVTFAPEYTGGGQYFEKLNTLIAANDVPDVLQMGNNFLTYKDHLAPLDDLIKSGVVDVRNTSDSFLSSARIGGRILGLSLGTNSLALVYDPDLFQKAGVAEPTDQWTWADFEKAAFTVKQKLGIFGASGMDDWVLGGWYYIGQNGTGLDVFNPSGTGLGYTDDRMLAGWFELKKRFVNAGVAPSVAEVAAVKDVQGEYIVFGKAAMIFAWSNQVAALFTAANRPLKLAVVPRISAAGPSGMFVRASQHMCVALTSKNQAAGAKFVSYFVNDIEANKVLQGERGIPIMSTVRTAIKPLVPATIAATFDFMDKVGRIASKPQTIEPPTELEVEDILRKLGEQVLFDKLTPAAAAARFREDATKVLSRK